MPETRSPRIRVGVVVERGGNMLLVCHRKADRRYWMLPGGGLQWGETIQECGIREVREETGIQVAIGRLLYVAETLDPQGTRHIVHLVMLGRYLGGALRFPTEEIIDTVEWVPVRELADLTLYPAIGGLLREAFQCGFTQEALHLGSLWAD